MKLETKLKIVAYSASCLTGFAYYIYPPLAIGLIMYAILRSYEH